MSTKPVIAPNCGIYASMEPFVAENDEWPLYHERLENYFIVMDISDAARKRAILLSCMGATTYKIVRDMVSPALPSAKSYDDICAVLALYYSPQVVVLKERKNFYATIKQNNETCAQWLARVRHMAALCKFGTGNDSVVLDKFITGLTGKGFERLCEEDIDTLTIARAIFLASKYDDIQENNTVNYMARNNRNSESKYNLRCIHCGYKNHASGDCRFRNATCHKCHKTGHIAPVCRKNCAAANFIAEPTANSVVNMSIDDRSTNLVDVNNFCEELWHINHDMSTENSFVVNTEIKKSVHKFVIDSGASVSSVNQQYFSTWFSPNYNVTASCSQLFDYSEHRIEVIGKFTPEISYGKITAALDILIVAGNGPPILGRDFFRKFGITLSQNHTAANQIIATEGVKCDAVSEVAAVKGEMLAMLESAWQICRIGRWLAGEFIRRSVKTIIGFGRKSLPFPEK